ncbi:NAD-dependent deacylase [Azorhizophilus paspali]|uniref:protein acetyllysine N-acetyltransferase n=1 Tax=Azorhizophilus paspali TaxID=69963 RepID=A0ABV6SNK1_AZOPA
MDTIERIARGLSRAERILVISGAGLSADSGLPTYRGLGGLYNGRTAEGLPIEVALSADMLRRDPALCWKYLAELGRACLAARPNAGHEAIAELQWRKPGCWVLTQNIDGYHRAAGSPPERLIEIHGELAPLYCQTCGRRSEELSEYLERPLPPRCAYCGGVLRPPVVLFGEELPAQGCRTLAEQLIRGFDAVLAVGTTASFPYIVEPVLRTWQTGGFTAEINPQRTDLSDIVDIHAPERASRLLPALLECLFRG